MTRMMMMMMIENFEFVVHGVDDVGYDDDPGNEWLCRYLRYLQMNWMTVSSVISFSSFSNLTTSFWWTRGDCFLLLLSEKKDFSLCSTFLKIKWTIFIDSLLCLLPKKQHSRVSNCFALCWWSREAKYKYHTSKQSTVSCSSNVQENAVVIVIDTDERLFNSLLRTLLILSSVLLQHAWLIVHAVITFTASSYYWWQNKVFCVYCFLIVQGLQNTVLDWPVCLSLSTTEHNAGQSCSALILASMVGWTDVILSSDRLQKTLCVKDDCTASMHAMQNLVSSFQSAPTHPPHPLACGRLNSETK